MAKKFIAFRAAEIEVKFLVEEAKRININISTVIKRLIQDAMQEKKKLSEIEGIKEVIRESQGVTKELVKQMVKDVTAMRFEVGCLSVDRFGESKTKEIKEDADELGEEKLADLTEKEMEEIQE